MGLEKSPGWDGITAKFFQEFWQELKEHTILIANRALQGGLMEDSMLKGVINAIPKQISCFLPKHWIPMSMMTVMYQIVANRLAPVLNRILTPHQHGFIKGRSIYDNILVAMVVIDYA